MATKRNLVLAVLVTSVVLAIGIAFVVWMSSCFAEIDVSIGEFESKEAALPIAIQRLSTEVNRCPQANTYRITWIATDPSANQTAMRRALLYDRVSDLNWLGYEQDCFSGFSDRPYVVDDAAIRAVAAKGGTLEDLKEYEQRTNRGR